MNESILKKIIEFGVMAPSGSNSQPWQFRLRDNSIEVYALPERDHALLNFRNRGTWVAHGALIENMSIAARSLGYELIIHLFPDSQKPTLAAAISIASSQKKDEGLAAAIPLRATNRKAYLREPLTSTEEEALIAAANEYQDGRLVMIDTPNDIEKMARAVSTSELVTLENKTLHNLFVREVAWTTEEERARGGGLYLKTMELAPPQAFMLGHFFRYWFMMNMVNTVGFAKMIARDNAKIYAQASAFGAIVVPDNDRAFITAGRMMERIWLEGVRLGLQFQLMTGVLFMHQRLETGDTFGLSDRHVNLVERAYADIASCIPASGVIALLFRVGHGDPPSAYSLKNPPQYLS